MNKLEIINYIYGKLERHFEDMKNHETTPVEYMERNEMLFAALYEKYVPLFMSERKFCELWERAVSQFGRNHHIYDIYGRT